MAEFINKLSLRWSDLDPNFHIRHTAYYDFGAQQRLEILQAYGISTLAMAEGHFGPVLFREECVFKKEIRLSDTVLVSTQIAKLRPDASRWTIVHQFLNEDRSKNYATLTVDGAWMDTQLRKLVSPVPQIIIDGMQRITKTADFEVA